MPLSRKFRITEHAQSSAVEYFNFFSIEINLSLQDLHFHKVMGIMLQKQVIYWDLSIFKITTLDPCHRRHESLGHLGVHRATSIQTFDFSTLYTSIPHDLLKSRMNNIVSNCFQHKNGAPRYTHIKVGRSESCFANDPLNGDNKYTADYICNMIEFLVDNIYVRFGGQLFRQMVGLLMGTNCAPLLAELFLYSYENEFLDKLTH